jgi:acetyl esterase/lipase/lysophospholipase L1-like esterase
LFFCLILSEHTGGQSGESQRRYTLLGFGDSITEGGEGFSSYLYPLWEKLFANGYRVDFVGPKRQPCRTGELLHAGYSGRNVEFLEQIIDSIYRQYPADMVLIHAGHNHFAEETPVPGMIAAYRSVIGKIKAINPDAVIFLAQVIPSGKLPKYSYIPELNREISRMTGQMNDRNVICVDQATGFDWETCTVDDRVHPNESGAERMAAVWYDCLIKALPVPPLSFHPETVPYKIAGTDTLKMHIFKPDDWKPGDQRPVIAYFFAGGWVSGTPLQFYRECAWYASKGMIAVSVEYRIKFLHGTTPDDSLEDAKDALCWLSANAAEQGIDTNRIAISGASAGGYLAAALGVEPADEKACCRPGLLVLNYPVLDRIKQIVTDIPPILFLVGSEDAAVPLPAVYQFKENIRKNNNTFELHIFEKAGHPIFYYRKDPDERFYEVRRLTDSFLMKYGYLKN